MDSVEADALLEPQVAYYRAVAPEYDEGVQHDRTELDRPELVAELERFAPAGDVLELAAARAAGPSSSRSTPAGSPWLTPPRRPSRSIGRRRHR